MSDLASIWTTPLFQSLAWQPSCSGSTQEHETPALAFRQSAQDSAEHKARGLAHLSSFGNIPIHRLTPARTDPDKNTHNILFVLHIVRLADTHLLQARPALRPGITPQLPLATRPAAKELLNILEHVEKTIRLFQPCLTTVADLMGTTSSVFLKVTETPVDPAPAAIKAAYACLARSIKANNFLLTVTVFADLMHSLANRDKELICSVEALSETASLPDDEAQFMHDSFNLFLAVSPIFLFVKPSKLLRRNNATHLLQVGHYFHATRPEFPHSFTILEAAAFRCVYDVAHVGLDLHQAVSNFLTEIEPILSDHPLSCDATWVNRYKLGLEDPPPATPTQSPTNQTPASFPPKPMASTASSTRRSSTLTHQGWTVDTSPISGSATRLRSTLNDSPMTGSHLSGNADAQSQGQKAAPHKATVKTTPKRFAQHSMSTRRSQPGVKARPLALRISSHPNHKKVKTIRKLTGQAALEAAETSRQEVMSRHLHVTVPPPPAGEDVVGERTQARTVRSAPIGLPVYDAEEGKWAYVHVQVLELYRPLFMTRIQALFSFHEGKPVPVLPATPLFDDGKVVTRRSLSGWNSLSRIEQHNLSAKQTLHLHTTHIGSQASTLGGVPPSSLFSPYVDVKHTHSCTYPLLREYQDLQEQADVGEPDRPGYHRNVSILQVLAEMKLGDKGDVVNLIDIPQPNYQPPTMPDCVRFLDHIDIIVHGTAKFFPLSTTPISPHTGRGWHLVGAAGSDTPRHHDASGCPTAITQLWGHKLWFVVRRDFGCNEVDKFCRLWADVDTHHKYRDIETSAILMKPGDVVVMPPGTEHYVLNITHSAMRGAQFLNRWVMNAALPGLINTTVLDYAVTNITHTETWAIYARFLLYWCHHLVLGDAGDEEVTPPPHDFQGTTDIFFLAITIILAPIFLGEELYKKTVELECTIAIKMFSEFRAYHDDRYEVQSSDLSSYAEVAKHVVEQIWGYFGLVRAHFPNYLDDSTVLRLEINSLREDFQALWNQQFKPIFATESSLDLPNNPPPPKYLFPSFSHGEITLKRPEAPQHKSRPPPPRDSVVMLVPIDGAEAAEIEASLLASHSLPEKGNTRGVDESEEEGPSVMATKTARPSQSSVKRKNRNFRQNTNDDEPSESEDEPEPNGRSQNHAKTTQARSLGNDSPPRKRARRR